MGKGIISGKEARQKVLNGVNTLANTVSVTMGPEGRNVILGKFVGAPTITKDGVSVAREVVLSDPYEELGCQLVKEVAGRTADVAGDGTTTATVLAQAIFSGGFSLVDAAKYSSIDFKFGVNWALKQVLENIENMAQPINDDETLENVAIISANNDNVLGKVIAKAYNLVGQTGMVMAEAMPGVEDSVRLVEGIEIKNGYISPGFLEKGQSKCTLANCHILICDREITHITDNEKLFNELSSQNKSLLIICKDLKKEALKIFLGNNRLGRIRACAVKIPTFGKNNEAWLEDLSILTDTTIVSEDRGKPLSEVTVADLGFAKSVEVGRHLTKIIGPKKDPARLKDRVKTYEQDLKTLIGDLVRKDIRDRMAFLSSSASVITVGYLTELELREKGDRVEDAMSAVKAAVEEGFVPGGGFALFRAASQIDLKSLEKKYHPGARMIVEACKVPAQKILENAQEDTALILNKVMKDNSFSFGYNCATREFGDLIEMGVIDPKKVTRTALENAASIALLLLTTEAIVAELPENESGWQPPAGWRQPSATGLDHKY